MSESSLSDSMLLIRYTAPPTQFDSAPLGTLCSVLKNDDGTEQELYIQMSPDEKDPIWISATELLLRMHRRDLNDPIFVRACFTKITECSDELSPDHDNIPAE